MDAEMSLILEKARYIEMGGITIIDLVANIPRSDVQTF